MSLSSRSKATSHRSRSPLPRTVDTDFKPEQHETYLHFQQKLTEARATLHHLQQAEAEGHDVGSELAEYHEKVHYYGDLVHGYATLLGLHEHPHFTGE